VQEAGKLVVFQSGGPTAVVNASLTGAIRAAKHAGVSAVFGARFGFEGVLARDYVNLSELSEEHLDQLGRTPGAGLGSSRHRPTDAQIRDALACLVRDDIRWVLAIGGNDTAETLHRLHELARESGAALAVVGIPKTIDNDLPRMDHCPGYGSAARYLAVSVREAGIDTAAMRLTDPIKIIEVMGRNSGWLAAASTLARESPGDAPQVVFLPERPRAVRQMVEDVAAAQRANGWCVVVISENQRDEAGQPLAGGEPVHVDAHGHPYYASAGAHLARAVQSELGLRSRYERPGSLQRTSALAISVTDASEAMAAGAEAARRALAGESDIMVAIQRDPGPGYAVSLGSVALADVARAERRLSEPFIAESGIDVTADFLEYAGPLIGPDPLPGLYWLDH
jgi:6-phosphofructokinase